MRKKLKLTCVLATLGAMSALAMAGTATAGENGFFEAGDPMDTNVPYVAWAGEEVRLVKCIEDSDRLWDDTDAEWSVVDSSNDDWNGDPRDPSFFDDTDRRTPAFDGGGEQAGRTCWAIDVEAVHPGMSRIEMAVDDGEGPAGSPILKHDFLVIWLAMSAPVLTELGETAFPGIDLGDQTGGSPADFIPRDIDGDGDLEFGPGLIRVNVTGSFIDLHNNARTLPSGWASLADFYAVDTDGRNPMRWDIHDDQLENLAVDHHTPTSFCGPPKTRPIDEVDNCLGSGILGELGPMSRLIGGTSVFTLGPFDPARPGTSFLPDGKLDAGDAPMPAARIDLSLAGGVGALEEADKHEIYSHDRTGAGDAHNLYAPFYVSLIPADASQELGEGYTTSGTTGPIPNNFPGYQTDVIPGVGARAYHFWDFLNEGTRNGFNACRDVGGDGQFGEGEFIPLPTGVDEATVYTDEHGEALAWFNADVGAALAPDDQGVCDLGVVNGPELLGTATITAESLDPFKVAFGPARTSNALVKNVFELAGKSLDCVPKGPNEVFCVEVIRDIRGNAVEGATVVFSADPMDRILGAQLEFGGYDTRGAECSAPNASDEVTCTTNELGQAGVVIVQTRPELVNVVAENAATRNGGLGVFRDRCVRFFGDGTTLPTDGPNCATPTDSGTPITPPPPAGNGASNDTVSPTGGGGGQPIVQQASVAASIVSLAGKPVPAAVQPEAKKPTAKAKAKAKKLATKLASARFVMVKGKRYLVLRANGTAKTAKVRITLVMKTGKVKKPVVRTIRTNRAVRLNLVVSKHVRTVRVSIAKR